MNIDGLYLFQDLASLCYLSPWSILSCMVALYPPAKANPIDCTLPISALLSLCIDKMLVELRRLAVKYLDTQGQNIPSLL